MESPQEQVQVITTLRSGKVIDKTIKPSPLNEIILVLQPAQVSLGETESRKDKES